MTGQDIVRRIGIDADVTRITLNFINLDRAMFFVYSGVALLLLVVGAVVFGKGRIGLNIIGIVRGAGARLIGVFLMVPLPTILALHVAAFSVAAAKGWRVRPNVVEVTDGIVLGLCVVAALIAFVTSDKRPCNESEAGPP